MNTDEKQLTKFLKFKNKNKKQDEKMEREVLIFEL